MERRTLRSAVAEIQFVNHGQGDKLQPGAQYHPANLTFAGWTDGDGSWHDGYHYADYFLPDGTYLGPDKHGIEPLFAPWL